jgi:GNAT superfamily N-acetyltransferase
MSIELRTIATHERDGVLDLLQNWLGDRDVFARYFHHDPAFSDDLCFVAVDQGRIVSTFQVFRKSLRINGAVVDVGGVGNVFTLPEYRERGIAAELLTRGVRAMEEHEFDLSLLFAVRLAFYGRLGWMSHLRHLTFIDSVRVDAEGSCSLAPFAAADLDAVTQIYERYNNRLSGPTVRNQPYWHGQLRYAGNPHEDFLVARDGDEIVAYARGTPLYDFYVVMEHGYLPGYEDALAQLICRLHATEGAAFPGTIAQLAVAPVVQERLRARGLNLRTVEDVFWMWRIISPARLAAKLGVPAAELETDDVFHRLLPPEHSVYWIADRF